MCVRRRYVPRLPVCISLTRAYTMRTRDPFHGLSVYSFHSPMRLVVVFFRFFFDSFTFIRLTCLTRVPAGRARETIKSDGVRPHKQSSQSSALCVLFVMIVIHHIQREARYRIEFELVLRNIDLVRKIRVLLDLGSRTPESYIQKQKLVWFDAIVKKFFRLLIDVST